MELPNAPFYRRWSVLLAGVIGLAAIAAVFGWLGLQSLADPGPPTTVPATVAPRPTTEPTTSFRPTTTRPSDVLWEAEGTGVQRSPGFRAPAVWHIEWDFDCDNFRELGGGNFKITGGGAFEATVDIQAYKLEDRGRSTFTKAGYGHLLVESVCERWTVTVLSG